VLILIQIVDEAGGAVPPANADVAGVEQLAELVADEIDDRPEVESRRDSFLDAVDERSSSRRIAEDGAPRLREDGEAFRCVRRRDRTAGLAAFGLRPAGFARRVPGARRPVAAP